MARLDLNSLSVEETEQICEMMGVDDVRELRTLGQRIPPTMIRGLALMALRREDPEATPEQAGKMQLKDLEVVLPAEAGAESAPNSGSTSSPSQESRAARRAARKKKRR